MPNVLPPQTGSPVLVLQHGQGWGRRAPPGKGEHTAGNPPAHRPTPGGSRGPTPRGPTRSTYWRLGAPGRRFPAPPPRSPSDLPAPPPPRPRPQPTPPRASQAAPPPVSLARCLWVCAARARAPAPSPSATLPSAGHVAEGWPKDTCLPRPSGGRRGELARAPGPAPLRPPSPDGATARVGEERVPVILRPALLSGAPSLLCSRHPAPSAAQRSTLPGPPLLKSLPWLWAFSSQILSGLSLKAGRHPPTPSPGPPAITPSLASLLCACLWATSLLVRSGADPKTSFLTPTECFF